MANCVVCGKPADEENYVQIEAMQIQKGIFVNGRLVVLKPGDCIHYDCWDSGSRFARLNAQRTSKS